jgi:threonine dehydrogenase-like Zn-dependent dehydrogenase
LDQGRIDGRRRTTRLGANIWHRALLLSGKISELPELSIDETWLQVERLLRAGRLSVDPVMTHTFALDQHAEAFELAGKGAAGKVLFAP